MTRRGGYHPVLPGAENAVSTPSTTLVVPCFNEAERLDRDAFRALIDDAHVSLLFVDDGSTDATREVLAAIAARTPRASVIAMPRNVGKAEAVRAGLREAIARGADIVGFVDADLATPPEEIRRLVGIVRGADDVDVLLAARVALMGKQIERRAWRHYLGRVFATAASMVIDQPIYDTQCGAKLFRVTPLLVAVLAEPFRSPWIFDVELLGRLLVGVPGAPGLDPSRLREEPLERWVDVAGSKVRARAFLRAPLELARIAGALAARRARIR